MTQTLQTSATKMPLQDKALGAIPKNENSLAKLTGQATKEAEKKKNQRNINELDNDAFMKLFLEQLKNQDPTAPMETDKIITQTAQLTQVEMMEQNKKTMSEVAEAMKSTKEVNEELKNFQEGFKTSLEGLTKGVEGNSKSSDLMTQMASFNTVAMIGKIAETDIFGANLTEGNNLKFNLYFDEQIDTSKSDASIKILDEKNNLITTIDLAPYNGKKGYIEFNWNGKNQNGKSSPEGTYKIIAEYNKQENGEYHQTRIGRGEVQSVIFKDGQPMLRMGELVAPISSALEFYARNEK